MYKIRFSVGFAKHENLIYNFSKYSSINDLYDITFYEWVQYLLQDNVELYNYINKVFMDDLMSLMVQVCFHHD